MISKKEARRISKTNILKLSSDEKELASGAIADQISGTDAFRRAHKVFIYLGTDTEPDTQEIVGLALMTEKTVAVPRVHGEDMSAVVISPYTNFKTNKWGILEPVGGHDICDIDVAIIPLVAFDGLKRAGHGKGYYDRFLACHDCFKIGIAFDCQQVKGLETDENDIPLDMLITEKRVVTCEGEFANEYAGEE